MKLDIHLTQDWPFERLAKYGPDITAAMKKLVDRFPNEMTLKSLAEDIITGKNQLWLILDEQENFKAFVTSEIKVNDATGYKTVLLLELAGDGGIDLVPMIAKVEAWAVSIGAKALTPIGREGWRKPLAKLGYKTDLVLYRKELTHG